MQNRIVTLLGALCVLGSVRAQEPVRVLAQWPNGMRLVEVAYSHGWIAPDAPLSPVLPTLALADAFVRGPLLQVTGGPLLVPDGSASVTLPVGLRVPAADKRNSRVFVATAGGFVQSPVAHAGALRATRRGLTRREELFFQPKDLG